MLAYKSLQIVAAKILHNLMEEYTSNQESSLQEQNLELKVEDDGLSKLEFLQETAESTKHRQPSEKELCEVIILMKEKLPYCRLDRVIKLLNDICLKEKQDQRRISSLLHMDDDYLSDDDLENIEKIHMQQQYARKFENTEAQPRFYEEREIAKLFCSKGYGYPTAREYLGENITPNRYNNVITTIVRLTYKNIEVFIKKNINPKFQGISREELKMIKTPLVNCRNWMTPKQADNFHRYVKQTYKITTDEPEKEVVLDLHQAIMNQLKARYSTYKHHRRGEEHSGWSEEMEHNFIVKYVQNTDLKELQKEMTVIHPASRSAFEVGKLRVKIGRLVKYAVRKVNEDRQKYGFTEFPLVNDYLTNKIIRASNAEDVRKRLLSYYQDKDRNAMKVRWVFEVINEYLNLSRNEVEEIEDSSCEVIAKQELKAEEVFIAEEKDGKKEETQQ